MSAWRRTTAAAASTTSGTEVPRDIEAVEAVVNALDGGITGEVEVHCRITETLVKALGFGYGAVWLAAADGAVHLAGEWGPMLAAFRDTRGGGVRKLTGGDGYGGTVLRTGKPVILGEDDGQATCLRWAAARAAGATSGCILPLVENGKVTALYEYYGSHGMPFFGVRGIKWASLGRLVNHARTAALSTAALKESLNDRAAVTSVVTSVGIASTQAEALSAALDTVRSAFGWAYGSYWALDEAAGVLRFQQESGSAGDEFRKVTLAASFAEGVGFSGRAWKARELVFVKDIGEMTDCVRAPAAQRAGVKSGVCFPLLVDGIVIGTMDFFLTETIELTESRAAALRNVQQLVSQRVQVLRRSDEAARNAQLLFDMVAQLRGTADDAGRVAEHAVTQARAMTDEVQALDDASAAVGDVIRIISGIAEQTNLLALNATIEAARAGELGKGFAVVASEVKDLARETAAATQRVSGQIQGIQTSSRAVAAGIHATSEAIGQLDAVQAQMGEVLDKQTEMARAFREHA